MEGLGNSQAFRGVAILLGAMLSLYVGILAWNATDGREKPPVRTFAVSGEGKETGTPDLATITLGHQEEEPTATEAQRIVTPKINALLGELEKLGIEKKDIKTLAYEVSPEYDWTDKGQRLRGFRASQSVQVGIRDFGKIGPVLALGETLALNRIGNLQFSVNDTNALQREAARKAVANARAMAETMAAALGGRVGKVISFSESGVEPAYPVYQAKMEFAADARAVVPMLEAGTQEITAKVTITYELE